MKIAWIGTGVMGAPMAGHLLGAGHTVVVTTRTRDRAAPLIDRGAIWADSPAAAADGADVVCSIVGFPDDVEQVHLGPDGSLAAANPPGLLVDLTTSRPSLARRIAEAALSRGIGSVDAPVSGGDVGARNATLSIMVGGRDEDVARAMPVFESLGSRIVHQGGPGAGQHCKMVNQIVIAASMIGTIEGLRYAEGAGLDRATVLESISAGAAGSWTLDNLAPRIIAGDFAPGFFVEHFLKDLSIALDEAVDMGLDLPGLSLAQEAYDRLVGRGHGDRGTHALWLGHATSK